jgi:predicted NBD/HSP70 family sugar kinase
MTALVFDIGGQNARAALSDERHRSLKAFGWRSTLGLARKADPIAAFTALLREMTEELLAQSVERVCLGVPGPVVNGIVSRLPTILGEDLVDIDLVALAPRLWPRADLWVCNEITSTGCAKLAAGWNSFFVMTCGSGIGGKLFIDGRPQIGRTGCGGEIGHWRVPGAPDLPCDCGGRGHLGAIASGRGALRYARHKARSEPEAFRASALSACVGGVEGITNEALVRHFHAADAWTVSVVAEVARALGSALALIHLASGVERFLITGGFASALGPGLADLIAEEAAAAAWHTGLDWTGSIEVADSGTEWGLLGALEYIRRTEPVFASAKVVTT